jgi:hypothetical protein
LYAFIKISKWNKFVQLLYMHKINFENKK